LLEAAADRRRAAAVFLARAGFANAERRPLAGDASFRRYERLSGKDAVLMDAPPPTEDVRPFARLARHLASLGLSAPAVLAEDATAGFLLLEDLGDCTFTRALAGGCRDGPRAPPDERGLYALAVDVLIHLHGIPAARAIPSGLPRYDDGRLLAEASLLVDWYLPAVMGTAPAPAARRGYADAWLALFPAVHREAKTLVLRDYHVDNLMWLPGRQGVAACGLLDFQDAVAGPAAYDLMSLLEDARRDVGGPLEAAMKERYLRAFPELARPGGRRDAFEAAYAVLAAQRHAKVIGIFSRLWVRDGKPQYLVHIPRVWRLLERAVAHPALAPVRDWLDRAVPRERRVVPAPAGARPTA
jgi:aminoglycoside/choline kinase family phosphotransferase